MAKRLGIIGGGQLGMMITEAAKNLTIKIIATTAKPIKYSLFLRVIMISYRQKESG